MPPEKIGIADTLIHKLTPRFIAIIFIIMIFLLTIVIIFAVHQGADVNLFGIRIMAKSNGTQPKDPAPIMSADKFIDTLPFKLRDTPENTRRKIEEEIRLSNEKSEKIAELERKVEDLEKTLADTADKLDLAIEERTELQNILDKSKDKFFSWIMRLEEEMAKWDGSINTEIRIEEKAEVFRLIQELLRRIGFYQGEVDGDPIQVREALRAYKIAKGFKDEELWNTITKETIISIVRDYADTLLKESRG